MSDNGIPLDKAELLSVLLESLMYGFSLLMFGGTIWALSSQRSTSQINRKMLSVACLLLLFSTVHYVIDIIRVMEGLVLYRDTWPGGPLAYFSDVAQWTFVWKNYVYTAQTLIGDGVILYRCYAVWQSKLIMVLPILLWCAVAVTGIGSPYTASQVTQTEVFGGSLSQWITSFYTSTLATNLLTTLILAYRIWYVDRKATSIRRGGRRKSQLRPILHIIIDAGVIYSLVLLAAIICFSNESNGQYVILDMVTPIISITFYMVIIRVGLANRATQPPTLYPLGYTSNNSNSNSISLTQSHGASVDPSRRSRMQVHITTLTESKIEHPLSPRTPTSSDNLNRASQIKFEEAVAVAV